MEAITEERIKEEVKKLRKYELIPKSTRLHAGLSLDDLMDAFTLLLDVHEESGYEGVPDSSMDLYNDIVDYDELKRDTEGNSMTEGLPDPPEPEQSESEQQPEQLEFEPVPPQEQEEVMIPDGEGGHTSMDQVVKMHLKLDDEAYEWMKVNKPSVVAEWKDKFRIGNQDKELMSKYLSKDEKIKYARNTFLSKSNFKRMQALFNFVEDKGQLDEFYLSYFVPDMYGKKTRSPYRIRKWKGKGSPFKEGTLTAMVWEQLKREPTHLDARLQPMIMQYREENELTSTLSRPDVYISTIRRKIGDLGTVVVKDRIAYLVLHKE